MVIIAIKGVLHFRRFLSEYWRMTAIVKHGWTGVVNVSCKREKHGALVLTRGCFNLLGVLPYFAN